MAAVEVQWGLLAVEADLAAARELHCQEQAAASWAGGDMPCPSQVEADPLAAAYHMG